MQKLIFIAVCLALGSLAGCAQSGPKLDDEEFDQVAEARQLNCPMTKAPVCVERIGKATRCFCSSRENMEYLLEPQRGPTGAEERRH